MQIEDIFEDMSLIPLLASESEAKEWMKKRYTFLEADGFGMKRCRSSDTLRDEEEDFFRKNAATGWSKMPRLDKALVFNKIADCLEKNIEIVSVLESMSTGRVIHRVRNEVVPFCVRVFRYYRSVLLRSDLKRPDANHSVFLYLPVISSLSLVVTKLVPALCSAADVRICFYISHTGVWTAENENFAVYFLEELLKDVGGHLKDAVQFFYPKKEISSFFDRRSFFDPEHRLHLHFVGTIRDGRVMRRMIPYFSASFDHGTCVVVFDGCDVDGAVDAVVRSLSKAAELIPDFRVLIHARIFEKFVKRFIGRLERLRVGVSLDRTADLGTFSSYVKDYCEPLNRIEESGVNEVRCDGFQIFSFRNTKEAIELARDSTLDLRTSIWTSDVSLALEVSKESSASTIWVNCIDVYDPAVPVASLKQSGNCVDGGEWGIEQYNNLSVQHTVKSVDLGGSVPVSSVQSKAWASLSAFRRSEILISALEELNAQKEGLYKLEPDEDRSEVDSFVEDFGYWASKCCSIDAELQNTSFLGRVIVTRVPIGSILFSIGLRRQLNFFVNFVLLSVAFGNTAMVTVARSHIPFFEKVVNVLTSRGLPPGVITVSGSDGKTLPSNEFDAHFILDLYYSLQRPLENEKFPVVIKYVSILEDDGSWLKDERFRTSLVSDFTRPKTVWLSS